MKNFLEKGRADGAKLSACLLSGDVSSREAQTVFKNLQRITVVTNALMAAVTLLALAMTVYVSTLNPWDSKSWAEIAFFILVGLIVAYFAFVAVWEVLNRRKQAVVLHAFVANAFYRSPEIMTGGGAFEISIAGDKLAVLREGNGNTVYVDISPVANFTGVCAAIVSITKKFIADYLYASAVKGGISDVKIVDRTRKKPRYSNFYPTDKAVKNRENSYFLKHGLIK